MREDVTLPCADCGGPIGDGWRYSTRCEPCVEAWCRRVDAAGRAIRQRWPGLPTRVAGALAREIATEQISGGSPVAWVEQLTDAAFLGLRNMGPTTLAWFRAVVPEPRPDAAQCRCCEQTYYGSGISDGLCAACRATHAEREYPRVEVSPCMPARMPGIGGASETSEHFYADADVAKRYGLRPHQRVIEVRYDDERLNGRRVVDEIHAAGFSLEMLDAGGLWMDVCGLRVEIRAVRNVSGGVPRLVVTCEPDACTPYDRAQRGGEGAS